MKPGDHIRFRFFSRVREGTILGPAEHNGEDAWEISWEAGVITLTESELAERLFNVGRPTLAESPCGEGP